LDIRNDVSEKSVTQREIIGIGHQLLLRYCNVGGLAEFLYLMEDTRNVCRTLVSKPIAKRTSEFFGCL
jgi:hypothetical protein